VRVESSTAVDHHDTVVSSRDAIIPNEDARKGRVVLSVANLSVSQ